MTSIGILTDDEFEALLSKYQYKFQKGDLVKGTITGYNPEGVLVYIGAKNDALVPEREAVVDPKFKMEETLRINDEYEFLVIREEDEDSRFLLSYKKVAQAYVWKELEELKNNNATVVGTITSIVKGGVLVDVGGLKGFVPLSHLRMKESEIVVGAEVELKILTLDSAAGNFILSNKKLFSDTQEISKKEIFSNLKVGHQIEGEIVRITDFGAFIDLNGIDGLLPLSQISWRWVEHPGDILKVGEKINVSIISVDPAKHRVSLSLKALEADPWLDIETQIGEGKKIQGRVTRIKHFGAFVEILDGVEALLPNSEVVEYQNKCDCIIDAGTSIMVTVTKFNLQDRRISLAVAYD